MGGGIVLAVNGEGQNINSVENIGVEPLAKLIIDFFRTSLSMCFIKMIIDLVVDI